ncbi:MAG: hypothetical protein M3167_06910 [Acidobacteriota bacterium]|nr:hypothetical protein [Acidobacteriota bacterium]
MTKAFRIALASATMVAGLAVAGARPANAQVEFRGSFPLPHGRLTIGHPSFRVGGFVPFGYRVYSRPGYGYGFLYRSRWIPVRRYSERWVVCESPEYAYGYESDYTYDGGYAYDPGYVEYYSPRYSYSYPRYSYAPGYAYRYHSDWRDNGRGWDRGWDHRRWDRGRDHDRGGRWNH